MSVDRWQYLGPYLKIKIPTEKAVSAQDPKCCGRVQSSGKFCSSCGKPLVSVKVEVERDTVRRGDIAEKLHYGLRYLQDSAGEGRDGFDYWLPNGSTPIEWNLPNHGKVGAHELIPNDIARTMSLFVGEYGDEIEILADEYKSAGEVKFGLLVWFS